MNLKALLNTIGLMAALILGSCANQSQPESAHAKPSSEWTTKSTEHGKASWYSIRTNRGTHTASGQKLENHAATAAHKTLPLGSRVRVTNLVNGKAEIVKITDRGPYIKGRIIDVTVGVAKRLNFYNSGVVPVKVEVLEKGKM